MDVGVVMQTKIKGQLVHIKQERTLLSRLLVIAKTRPEFVVKDAIGNFEFNVAPPSNFHPDGSMIMLSSKSQLVLLIMKMSAPVGASNVVQYEENVSIRVLIIDAMCLVNMVVKTPEMTTVKQFFTKFLGIIQGVSASYDELRIVFDQYIPGTLKETTREKRSLKLAHMRSKAQITPARLQEKECHEFKHLNFIVSAPLQCIVISAILWFNVGALPLIGVFVLIIMIPVQIVFGKTLYTLRKKFLKSTDARIKLIHEIICSMKIIKLYAWEESFWKQIYEKRKHEFSYLKRIAKYHGGSVVIFKNMINVVVLLTMVGFVLQTQEAMSVPNVYLAITMYYSVKHSISEYFAKGLNSIGQLTSSLQRIQVYDQCILSVLTYGSETWAITDTLLKKLASAQHSMERKILGVKWRDRKTNSWKFLAIEEYSQGYENLKIDLNKEKLLKDPIDTDHILKGISFKLHPGNLLCVIGEVGSGKTSLLKTVLEEMVIKSGSMKLRGKVAYACQQSWIFSDTIKNNILFGSKYEEKRYQEVIDACCLSKDINNMLNGDGTIVGERGIRLSGGQRARVSLARTLYHNADIYLLDDPLSAVDNEVGNHIYSRCIQSFLANKITILVTHRVNYLRHAPRILLLRKNDEPLYGTYEDLIEKHPQFSSFYTHFLEQDEISKKKVSKIELTEVKLKDKGSEDLYKLDKIENATSESVSLGVYKDFFRAAGNPFLILFTSLLLNIIYSLIVVGFDYWIKLWTEAEDQKKSFINNGNLIGSTDHDGFSLNSLLQNRWNSLLVLLVISVLLVLFSIPTVMFDISFCIRAARNLHDRMFGKLLHAPIKFFNCEILNRFTKDIGHIDELIPKEYQEVMQDTIRCITMLVIVCIMNSYLIIVTVILSCAVVWFGKIYSRSYTAVKRAENITRSPVFTHVSITLDGLSTIRAYGDFDRFVKLLHNLQDLNMATCYLHVSIQKCFSIYTEFLTAILVCVAILMPVLFLSPLSASSIGFLITQLVYIYSVMQTNIRKALDLQSKFTSVERVLEYGNIKSESYEVSAGDEKPSDNWPENGSISAYKMSLAYDRKNFVLKDISFSIIGGQKVGIVGRTGAGKTSLINAIFRLEESTGRMIIDGIDISKLGLHQLRKKLTVIPQEPLLFQNTIRYNLDPFGDYCDVKIWEALESVEMKSVIRELPQQLDTELTEGSFSLSFGQQQLICLARAVLKENRIIILDEATSNVDVITDKIIQRTIRTKFKDFTVITIAHRIHTIIDADVVVVMDNGKVIELDSPKNLVQNNNSNFYKMIMETEVSAPLLIKQAMESGSKSFETIK
ncbi:Multidrug resistance-associated protein 4 [Nymphon striatum]|nr:Multidrug resistance-associated protein 4 [Nymphon striatum]